MLTTDQKSIIHTQEKREMNPQTTLKTVIKTQDKEENKKKGTLKSYKQPPNN